MIPKIKDLTYYPQDGDVIQASDFKLIDDSINITEKLKELEQRVEELEEEVSNNG